jgi:hypothetical protein
MGQGVVSACRFFHGGLHCPICAKSAKAILA